MPNDESLRGAQRLASATSMRNALDFVGRMLMGQMATQTVVKVLKVYPPASPLGPVGTVDVQPCVNLLDGSGNASEHGPLYGLPYFRLQGGTNAIVLDPAVGDLGMASFMSRDISSVKANKGKANPGSRRQFDMADGLYTGGFMNGTPVQYILFDANQIKVVSPTAVNIVAPNVKLDGAVEITGALTVDSTSHLKGAVTGDAAAVFTGDVTGNGKVLGTHKHGGVTTGGGQTGTPV